MNSIIADNFRAWDLARDDCYTVNAATPFFSHGHNLFSSSSGCTITYPTPQQQTDLFSIQPGLLPPASFGGPTRVVELTQTSPALDRAPCLDWNAAAVREDQRGASRPKGPACDSGAFERSPYDYYFPVARR